MSTSPFPIRTPRDLLNKAKREIDELEQRAEGFRGEPGPIAIGHLTWNAACSLWRVTDWIVNSPDANLQARPGRTRASVSPTAIRVRRGGNVLGPRAALQTLRARGRFDCSRRVRRRSVRQRPAAWPPDMSAGAKERVSITIPLVSSVALTVRASADCTARALGFLPRSPLTRR